jgi:hypothetical protein
MKETDGENNGAEFELQPLPRLSRNNGRSQAEREAISGISIINGAPQKTRHLRPDQIAELRKKSKAGIPKDDNKPAITAPTSQDTLFTDDAIEPHPSIVRQFEPSEGETKAHRARISKEREAAMTPAQKAARIRSKNSPLADFNHFKWGLKPLRRNAGPSSTRKYGRVQIPPPFKKWDEEAHARVCAVMVAKREELMAQDRLKDPQRKRQHELEQMTPWQRFVWRMSCKPCWEMSEGCFFENPDNRWDGSKHGHGDGLCVYLGWRECCCMIGAQHCAEDACCEGAGCVKCCGWTHGFWQICDSWTWGCFGDDSEER